MSPPGTAQDRSGSYPGSFSGQICRRKRRAQRELYSSSRQSRLTDIAEINTKSPAIFMSWRALSRQKLSSRGTARHGCLSRSRGTFSGTIQRTAYKRVADFDDSIRWTSVATSRNMIPGDNISRTHRIFSRFREFSAKRDEKKNMIRRTTLNNNKPKFSSYRRCGKKEEERFDFSFFPPNDCRRRNFFFLVANCQHTDRNQLVRRSTLST